MFNRLLITITCLCLLCAKPAPSVAADPFKAVDNLVNESIRDGVFPSASIAVINKGTVVYHRAFGKQTYDRQSPPVTTTTIYDLASLTKPIVTTSIAMQLVEHDSLDINAPVSHYLPGFARNGKEKITIKNLLLHNSGLRAHRFFIESCKTPDEVYEAISDETPIVPTGSKTIYSDLGFITLGNVIETITANTLEENFSARFSVPLGMHSTLFTPSLTMLKNIAPTEKDSRWTLDIPRPLVHDHNAALLRGVAGHAGLFSTTGDLIIFATMLMQHGSYGGKAFFKPQTITTFTQRHPGSRALGWDLRSIDGPSSSGDHFSAKAYGHLGFTGTSIWIDPEKDLAVITLTNRVYPTSDNIKIRKFRPKLHNPVIECLGLRGGEEVIGDW